VLIYFALNLALGQGYFHGLLVFLSIFGPVFCCLPCLLVGYDYAYGYDYEYTFIYSVWKNQKAKKVT